jgi:hypothetical protein
MGDGKVNLSFEILPLTQIYYDWIAKAIVSLVWVVVTTWGFTIIYKIYRLQKRLMFELMSVAIAFIKIRNKSRVSPKIDPYNKF